MGLIENCKKVNEPLHAAEDRLLQTNHAAVGATLLEHWDFPVRIVSTIRAQHSPCSASSELAPLAAVLYTANLLAYRSGNGYGFPDYAVHPDPEILAMARRQPEELRELVGGGTLPGEADHDFHTAAGMVIAYFGRIPHVGESFSWNGWMIEVVDLDGPRIDKLLLQREIVEEESDADDASA